MSCPSKISLGHGDFGDDVECELEIDHEGPHQFLFSQDGKDPATGKPTDVFIRVYWDVHLKRE